jgi:cytoskeletal protein RodZ
MAGTIGVGPALRRAREIRGITVDEAARDTKLRCEQLRALEDEDFLVLGDQVYTRAMLRTYAQYLGLTPDRVVGIYARHSDGIAPPPPPGKLGRVERGLAASRVRDSQRFLLVAAAVVLVALIAVGLVSRGGAPQAAPITTPSSEDALAASHPSATEGGVDVVITATAPVQVTYVIDRVAQDPTTLRPGEQLSLMAAEELEVMVSDGGAIELIVDGDAQGVPGRKGSPWTTMFRATEAAS